MATFRGHLVAGLAVFGAIAYLPVTREFFELLEPVDRITAGLACLLGSLFPDVDTKSVGQWIFMALAGVCLIFSILDQNWVLSVALLGFIFVPLLGKHRGLTHRPVFLLAIPLFFAYCAGQILGSPVAVPAHIYVFFVIGAISHVILDALFALKPRKLGQHGWWKRF
ncbi:metal-dependent hydrolase [bacterium]|nr:metal-dependent hydrolase [bacterium]